jgi:hypothetical protein
MMATMASWMMTWAACPARTLEITAFEFKMTAANCQLLMLHDEMHKVWV